MWERKANCQIHQEPRQMWGLLLTSLEQGQKWRTPRGITVLSDTKQYINSFKQRIYKITLVFYIYPASSFKVCNSLVFSKHTMPSHDLNPLYMQFLCRLKAHKSYFSQSHSSGHWLLKYPASQSLPLLFQAELVSPFCTLMLLCSVLPEGMYTLYCHFLALGI